MAKPVEYLAIKVGALWYRAEPYAYPTCSEVLIRGPFIRKPVFQPSGKPTFMQGHHTAFKLVGKKPMNVNLNRSKKGRAGDPKTLPDWKPFYTAYALKKGWIAEYKSNETEEQE